SAQPPEAADKEVDVGRNRAQLATVREVSRAAERDHTRITTRAACSLASVCEWTNTRPVLYASSLRLIAPLARAERPAQQRQFFAAPPCGCLAWPSSSVAQLWCPSLAVARLAGTCLAATIPRRLTRVRRALLRARSQRRRIGPDAVEGIALWKQA